jgi:DNA-directed RNA polymerase specialized sigma24 family protein
MVAMFPSSAGDPAGVLGAALADAADAVDDALLRLAHLMEERAELVRLALADGWSPDRIADRARLTVGQVWNAGRGERISPPDLPADLPVP